MQLTAMSKGRLTVENHYEDFPTTRRIIVIWNEKIVEDVDDIRSVFTVIYEASESCIMLWGVRVVHPTRSTS